VYLGPVTAAVGVTQGEAHVLAHLARGGPTTVAALHREFGHKRSTLTNILNRLEERRFIRRELNPKDRRSLIVHLTASGRPPARRVTEVLHRLEHDLRARVGEPDVAGLQALVHALDAIVSCR